MKTPLYRRAVKNDLDRWIEQGLVSAAHRDAILADIGTRGSKVSVVGILAMLGAIFMALAGISFIAANWGSISKIIRFGFILSLMWSSFLIALYALKRDAPAFAHAFALIGAALFGGGIMLVAQIFNISAHYPNGIVIWSLGALAVAMTMRSRAVLFLATLLGTLWMLVSYWGPLPHNPLNWFYPVLTAVLFLIARRLGAREAAHVLVLATLIWVANVLALQVDQGAFTDNEAVSLYPALMLALLLAAGWTRSRGFFGARIFQLWTSLALLASAFALQFALSDLANDPITKPGSLWVICAICIFALGGGALYLNYRDRNLNLAVMVIPLASILALLSVSWLSPVFGDTAIHLLYGAMFFTGAVLALLQGARNEQKNLLWVGGTAFAAEALYAYFETFKDLLSTSLFFFIGGALLLSIALIALRFGKQLKGGDAS